MKAESKVLGRMLQNMRAQDPGLSGICALYTMSAVAVQLLPVLLSYLVVGKLTDPAADARSLMLILGGFLALAGLSAFLKEWLHGVAKPRITALRIDYVRDQAVKLIEMDYAHTEDAGFFERWRMAFQSVGGNNDGMEGIYGRLFLLPEHALLVLLLLGLLSFLHPLTALGLLLHAGITYLLQAKAQDYEYSRQADLSREQRRAWHYGSAAQDFRCGKDVRLYDLKERVLKNFQRVIEGYQQVFKAVERRDYGLGLLALPMLLVSDLLIYGLLARAVGGGLPIASFSMYLMGALTLQSQMTQLTDALSFIRRGSLYVADFYRFLDKDLHTEGGTLEAPEDQQPLDIRFDKVSFRYPGSDQDVLHDFSLHIPAGQRLALVGINGAGKSTIVKLICGFFAPQQGQVLINGQPVQSYRKQALYGMLSAVFQDVNILAFTVAENVAGCQEGIDRERVQSALEELHLWDKVQALHKGMDTMMLKVIEEDGLMLSGGEQQKLAVARALYKGGQCIILDEPTAALDALAEQELYQSFDRLTEGRTAIYISHRLASTQFCDRIALLEGASLRQYGSHRELMAEDGPYREMFLLQAKYYQEGATA